MEQSFKSPSARNRERRKQLREAAKGPLDWTFLSLLLVLLCIGLLMVLSASFPSAYAEGNSPFHYFKRQILFSIMGSAVMLWMSTWVYQYLKAVSKPFLILAFILLVLVLIPGVGITRNNATRWLGVGEALTFQPSEVAKMAVILYFSDRLSKQKGQMNHFWKDIVYPYGIILLAMAGLMMFEPHLSGTVLILSIGAVLLIVGGLPTKLVLGALAVGSLCVVGYIKAVTAGILHYGASRIATWHDPFNREWFKNEGWQLGQSQLAIGSGGLLGVGLGKSRQKFLYLPEEHNDFIFAVICEELGYVGAVLIILLFMALILRGYWIALHAPDRFGSLLVVGVMTHIALQTFLNIAVVTGLVPTTGISLPFFSYGGTALMMQLVEMGVVLSVSRQMVATKEG